MHIEEFNELAVAEAEGVLRACADIPTWAERVVAARPFPNQTSLLAYADSTAGEWTTADVEKALADHPRIGETHSGEGASAAHSAGEQSGVDPRDREQLARLADGNRRYEETFGRIYLVRAAGRSAEEMLALLEQRLTNDPETELVVTAGELREIAGLRLRAVVS